MTNFVSCSNCSCNSGRPNKLMLTVFMPYFNIGSRAANSKSKELDLIEP